MERPATCTVQHDCCSRSGRTRCQRVDVWRTCVLHSTPRVDVCTPVLSVCCLRLLLPSRLRDVVVLFKKYKKLAVVIESRACESRACVHVYTYWCSSVVKTLRQERTGRYMERPATCTVQHDCCSRSGRVASAWTCMWRTCVLHRRAAAAVHACNAATQHTRKQQSTQQRRRRTTRARRSQQGPHQGRRCCCLSPTW